MPKTRTSPSLRGLETCSPIHCPSSKVFKVKDYIKSFKHNCQHSAVIWIAEVACGQEEKTQVHRSPTSILPPYIRWLSAWFKHADNLSMIPALRGEGLPSTCFISATHLSSSVPPPTPPPPHSSLLPPASLVIQISLLSAHISEAPQFACQLA